MWNRLAIAVGIVLFGVTSATAAIEVFFTSPAYGLTDPNLTFVETLATPNSDATAYDAVAVPVGPDVSVYGYEPLYVWLEFVNEPAGAKLHGLHLDYLLDSDHAGVAEWTSYRGDVAGGEHDVEYDRWQGPAGWYASSTGATLPMVHVAVTSWGIQNRVVGGTDFMTYVNSEGNVTALLGAVRFDTTGLATAALGSLGAAYSMMDDPEDFVFHSVEIVNPEPTSLLLLGLLGILLRRRT